MFHKIMSLLETKPFVENWWLVICKETLCQVAQKSCTLLCRPALLAATVYPLLQVLQPVPLYCFSYSPTPIKQPLWENGMWVLNRG